MCGVIDGAILNSEWITARNTCAGHPLVRIFLKAVTSYRYGPARFICLGSSKSVYHVNLFPRLARTIEISITSIKDVMIPEELFDSIGPAYEIAFAGLQPQLDSINWILHQIRDQRPANVLDLGCGTGRPVCSAFADAGQDVLGVDISGIMLSDA